MTPAYGCVVLTAGRRPGDLRRAIESLQRQEGVETDIVVVGNGCRPDGVPDGVRVLALEEDAGIPGGRNAGVPHVRGELLFFLDDDAAVAESDGLARVAGKVAADPALGIVQLRVDPRGPGRAERTWVPRLRPGDRTRGGDV